MSSAPSAAAAYRNAAMSQAVRPASRPSFVAENWAAIGGKAKSARRIIRTDRAFAEQE
jgi:hypothetical protein